MSAVSMFFTNYYDIFAYFSICSEVFCANLSPRFRREAGTMNFWKTTFLLILSRLFCI